MKPTERFVTPNSGTRWLPGRYKVTGSFAVVQEDGTPMICVRLRRGVGGSDYVTRGVLERDFKDSK